MNRETSSGAAYVPRSRWLLIHTATVFAFLYLPIVILILYSFNGEGVGGFPPHHLTLNWYRILFADEPIWDSVLNSLQVAFAAMVIALAFGMPAALALDRAEFPGKALFRRLVLLPLILPGIITGLSLLMLFDVMGTRLSLMTIVLGHGTALISVATTEVFAGLQKLDRAPGRSLARPGRQLLANLLADYRTKPEAAHHRRGAADFHAFDGRNRGQLFPDRPRQHAAS